MSRETDIAWAAGLFEGEGSLGHGGRQSNVRLTLVSTDFDVVYRFAEIVGGGRIRHREPSRSRLSVKPMLEWQVDYAEALGVLDLLMPYFGERRTARAKQLLSDRSEWIACATEERPCAYCGRLFQPPFKNNSRQQRFCEPACRAKQFQVVRKTRRRGLYVERTA